MRHLLRNRVPAGLVLGALLLGNAAMLATPAAADPRWSDEPQGSIRPNTQYEPGSPYRNDRSYRSNRRATVLLPAGADIPIRLEESIDLRNAQQGDTWDGTISDDIVRNGRVVVPAGSRVIGEVAYTTDGGRNDRGAVALDLRQIEIDGRTYAAEGGSDEIVADNGTQGRNTAVIAGATVVGAILGHAVSHNAKGTILGGLLGAGVSAAAVHGQRGNDTVIPAGTLVSFRTSNAIVERSGRNGGGYRGNGGYDRDVSYRPDNSNRRNPRSRRDDRDRRADQDCGCDDR